MFTHREQSVIEYDLRDTGFDNIYSWRQSVLATTVGSALLTALAAFGAHQVRNTDHEFEPKTPLCFVETTLDHTSASSLAAFIAAREPGQTTGDVLERFNGTQQSAAAQVAINTGNNPPGTWIGVSDPVDCRNSIGLGLGYEPNS